MSFFDECAGNIEQQNAYRMIANTNNSFFLTGKAGTGKSTFLRHICDEVKKRFVVLAPTGVAAMNVKGQTIHSFFGLSYGVQGPNNYGSIDKDRIELLNKIDTIIIDEVSMVRCDMVDVMDRMLRRHRNDPHPFGGVQVVFVGDLFQLPPVINMADKALLRKFYKSTGYYFYDSNVLSNVKLPKIEFTKVYRQNDPAFIELLDRFRVGSVQQSDISKLNTRVVDEDLIGIDDSFRITLTTRRDDAALINDNRLAEIDAPLIYIYGHLLRRLFEVQGCCRGGTYSESRRTGYVYPKYQEKWLCQWYHWRSIRTFRGHNKGTTGKWYRV